MNSEIYVTLEQFASRVLEITNRYSNVNHVSYDPGNLNGKCAKYPAYGDFPETYGLRQYGTWWRTSNASYQKPYRQTDVDPLGVEDFITVRFDLAVIPTSLFIYETYNPGSIVRIWGRQSGSKWILMWEGAPQRCPQEARKFQPDIRSINCFIDTIRLELNCTQLHHHACFDAILLIGLHGPRSEFQMRCLSALNSEMADVTINDDKPLSDDAVNHFEKLPYEILIYIFQLLDLKSLSNCACVCTYWNQLAKDRALYQSLSFKENWHLVDTKIFKFLKTKCAVLKKLDLSWCGNDDESFPRKFYQFLQIHCSRLTHLSLRNASWFNISHITVLSSFCGEIQELRLKNVFISDLVYLNIQVMSKFTKLVTLDLSCTNFDNDTLTILLMSNRNLKYLNIDFCDVGPLDDVIECLAVYNTQLKGLSCWKGRRLTFRGVDALGKLHELEDLDLGWCLNHFPQQESLKSLAEGCKELRRLILTAWRPLVDAMLLPVILNCTKLEQLDLLSITGITPEFVEDALSRLPNLKLLELSYCDSIPLEKVRQWRILYPGVTIQKTIDFD